MRNGGVHIVICVNEVFEMWWLEFKLSVHECINHFKDVFIEQLNQIQCNFVEKTHLLEIFVMTYSNHVYIVMSFS
jgi:hypothetical protein